MLDHVLMFQSSEAKTMEHFACPLCGKGKMEAKTIPLLRTRFEGVAIEVTDAKIFRCSHCSEESYGARELRRWKEIKRARG